MKFSTVAALCVAPLALAGSFDFNGLTGLERREDIIVESSQTTSENSNGKSSSKNSKGNDNSKGSSSNTGSSSTTTEVIIIWVNEGAGAATSTVNSPAVATAAAAVATHSVTVGGAGGLVYTPDSITAAVGDMVVFEFQSQNHTVTQSAFTSPCVALAGGTDSGFMANPNNSVSPAPQMAMQVTVATPIWFYCKQTGHCGKGMAFSINPTANKTQAMFQQMAIAQNGTGSTAGIAASTAATTLSTATASAVASASTGTIVSGTGTDATGGACTCSCLCGVADFPIAAIQGRGAFGGMSGAMAFSALEA